MFGCMQALANNKKGRWSEWRSPFELSDTCPIDLLRRSGRMSYDHTWRVIGQSGHPKLASYFGIALARHVDDESRAGRRQRLPIWWFRAGGTVSGYKDQRMGRVAIRQRYFRTCRSSQGGSNAGNNFEVDVGATQCRD